MTDDRFLGLDLDLGFIADDEGRTFAQPYSRVDLQARRRVEVAPRADDLGTVRGRANLVQSLILRLKTERGEVAGLGHPTYGSNHHQLVGEPNTEGNRNLIKLYVLECLRQEPRLERVVRIDVRPAPGRQHRDKVDIDLELKLKGVPDPLILVVPFSFEGPLA
jgi:phage baseplate assembly protein W